MTKRPKKAKTLRVKGGENTKDNVTGLVLGIDGNSFLTSDTTYSNLSPQYKAFWSQASEDIRDTTLSTASGNIKFELSNSLIVWTYNYLDPNGKQVSGRQLLEGDFKFPNGAFKSGTAKRAISYTIRPDGDSELTGIYSTAKASSKLPGNNLDSVVKGYYSLFTSGKPFLFAYEDNDVATPIPAEILTDGFVSRFFPPGWNTNPFATNLI